MFLAFSGPSIGRKGYESAMSSAMNIMGSDTKRFFPKSQPFTGSTWNREPAEVNIGGSAEEEARRNSPSEEEVRVLAVCGDAHNAFVSLPP
jgi:hypothetical protein